MKIEKPAGFSKYRLIFNIWNLLEKNMLFFRSPTIYCIHSNSQVEWIMQGQVDLFKDLVKIRFLLNFISN